MRVATLTLLALSAGAWGQSPSSLLNQELPEWLHFSGEYRARLEGFDGGSFKPNTQDLYGLSRLRFGVAIQPTDWLRFVGQAQDSRVFWNDIVAAAPPYQDTFDLRVAYAEFGGATKPVTLRVGRQELEFGEQRLVGSLNWTNEARTFDAVRATIHWQGYRLDAFASSLVVPVDGGFDHHAPGNDLHGLYGGIEKLVPNAVIEPYVLWRVAPRQKNEDGKLGSLDTKTGGVRFAGKLPEAFDYSLEMAIQRGNIAADPVGAWAGHWNAGHTFAAAWQPRAFVEFNYASGDRNPHDSHIGTFDQLYPTGHDKYGMADQVGWRNIEDLRFGVETKPMHSLKASLVVNSWHLASATDGLYNAAGALLLRSTSGTAGTHVGEEIDAQGLWTVNKQVQLGAGIGHIFPGEFLKRTTPGHAYTFPYMMAIWAF
jgi:hypothetical protein